MEIKLDPKEWTDYILKYLHLNDMPKKNVYLRAEDYNTLPTIVIELNP
jgi:hypothetical protein